MYKNFEEFIVETFTPYQKQLILIAPIDRRVASLLSNLGVNPSGFFHAVDRYGLVHALKEHEHDAVPLTTEDFKKIPEIVSSYDSVVHSGKSNLHLESLRYTKRFNGTIFYVEEVRTGKKELIFKTMYKKRTEHGASTADHPKGALTHTSTI